MYLVPILAPQPQGLNGQPGVVPLNPTCTVGIPYDIGQEFPTDPLRLLLAWSSCDWQYVGTYNGK